MNKLPAGAQSKLDSWMDWVEYRIVHVWDTSGVLRVVTVSEEGFIGCFSLVEHSPNSARKLGIEPGWYISKNASFDYGSGWFSADVTGRWKVK